jgi:uncharacterized membrane protein YidH (DUF202 family)
MQLKPLAIVLLIIGIVMIAYTGFTYYTTEKVVDLGVIEINKEKSHPISWSPIIGIILFVAGLIMLLRPKK